jgi:hypothetical protein
VAPGARPLALGFHVGPSTASGDRGFSTGAPMFTAVYAILYVHMTAPQIYVSFPGTAREALGFYADVFGGELSLHSYEDFSRSDGPPAP